MDNLDLIFKEDLIRNKLYLYDSSERTIIKDEFFTPSAVLFSIIPHVDKPYELVVIHRTDKGVKHRGEMSFPGGKIDPQDNSLMDTALRETEEEIGVPRENIRIIGCLHDFPTMSQYIITPFIGIIKEDQVMKRDEREVQAIVKVPINFFVNKKHFREQTFEIAGKKLPVFYFNYRDKITNKTYTIWGATAYMIVNYIELVYGLKMSKLGIRRFNIQEIKDLKDFLKYRDQITEKLK
ncbi:MAG: NUDIX hydrolase [Promethearchaeota archaeon]